MTNKHNRVLRHLFLDLTNDPCQICGGLLESVAIAEMTQRHMVEPRRLAMTPQIGRVNGVSTLAKVLAQFAVPLAVFAYPVDQANNAAA